MFCKEKFVLKRDSLVQGIDVLLGLLVEYGDKQPINRGSVAMGVSVCLPAPQFSLMYFTGGICQKESRLDPVFYTAANSVSAEFQSNKIQPTLCSEAAFSFFLYFIYLDLVKKLSFVIYSRNSYFINVYALFVYV